MFGRGHFNTFFHSCYLIKPALVLTSTVNCCNQIYKEQKLKANHIPPAQSDTNIFWVQCTKTENFTSLPEKFSPQTDKFSFLYPTKRMVQELIGCYKINF